MEASSGERGSKIDLPTWRFVAAPNLPGTRISSGERDRCDQYSNLELCCCSELSRDDDDESERWESSSSNVTGESWNVTENDGVDVAIEFVLVVRRYLVWDGSDEVIVTDVMAEVSDVEDKENPDPFVFFKQGLGLGDENRGCRDSFARPGVSPCDFTGFFFVGLDFRLAAEAKNHKRFSSVRLGVVASFADFCVFIMLFILVLVFFLSLILLLELNVDAIWPRQPSTIKTGGRRLEAKYKDHALKLQQAQSNPIAGIGHFLTEA